MQQALETKQVAANQKREEKDAVTQDKPDINLTIS
jgi:hypothetical protein